MKTILRLLAITFLANLYATEIFAQIDINAIDFTKPKYVLTPKQMTSPVRTEPTSRAKVNDDYWCTKPYYYASNELSGGWYKIPGGYVSATSVTAVKNFAPLPQKDFSKTWCGISFDTDFQIFWRFVPVKGTDFYLFNIVDEGEFTNFYIAKKVDNMYLLYASAPVKFRYDPKNPDNFEATAKEKNGQFYGLTITFGRNKGLVYKYDSEGYEGDERIILDLSILSDKFVESIFDRLGKPESYVITAHHLTGSYYDQDEPTVTSFTTNPEYYEGFEE